MVDHEMNPLMFFRSAPYIVIAFLIAALGWTTHLYLGKRDQLAALTASVQALGQAAEKVVEEKKVEYANNLETVKKNHEALAGTIRAAAVRNYVAAHPDTGRVLDNTSRSAVPGATGSQPMDDAPVGKPVPDETLLGNCADDANKVAAWQQWAQLNHIPIKD